MKHTPQRAFTLIEFIYVIALLGVIGMTVRILLESAYARYNTSNTILTQTAEWPTLLQWLRQDLSTSLPMTFTTMTTTHCVFRNSQGNLIDYSFNAGTLTRSNLSANTSAPLSTQLYTSLGAAFQYWKNDGKTPATDNNALTYLSITLISRDQKTQQTEWILLNNAR